MAATFHGFKVVAAAGVAVPLAAVATPASWITIYPRIVGGTANTGQVRLGGIPPTGTNIPSGSGAPLNPGDAAVVWYSGGYFDLHEVYVDADTNGDGVQFMYGVV